MATYQYVLPIIPVASIDLKWEGIRVCNTCPILLTDQVILQHRITLRFHYRVVPNFFIWWTSSCGRNLINLHVNIIAIIIYHEFYVNVIGQLDGPMWVDDRHCSIWACYAGRLCVAIYYIISSSNIPWWRWGHCSVTSNSPASNFGKAATNNRAVLFILIVKEIIPICEISWWCHQSFLWCRCTIISKHRWVWGSWSRKDIRAVILSYFPAIFLNGFIPVCALYAHGLRVTSNLVYLSMNGPRSLARNSNGACK